MRTIAVIPAYNEEKKISGVVWQVAKYIDRIVVIDDGSIDSTSDSARHKKAVVLRHPVNLGQGAALQTGFEYAKEQGFDVVITYDADGQFEASDIPSLIRPIAEGRADVVLGSRFLGRVADIPLMRLIVLRAGIIFTYIFSNIRLSDTHNGFRAFNKKAISKIDIQHDRWAHPSDIIYQISKNRFRVVEVPVTIRYTEYSKRKGQSNLEALRIPFELIAKALLE